MTFEIIKRFPSPIGESYFSMGMDTVHDILEIVSVPYRGILFFNKKIFACDFETTVFPSPIGESYFSIGEIKMTNKEVKE